MAAGTSSEPEDIARFEKLGLVAKHSYGILEVVKNIIDKDGNTVNLVKLRNPWGKFEWKGDWDDHSDLWTEEIKRLLAYDPEEDDGIFWMNFDDFK